MDSDEVKQRLSACRPGSDDHLQPELADAWQAAQNDPDLREWAEQENTFDKAMKKALDSSIPVPADLRERLLKIGEAASAQRARATGEPAATDAAQYTQTAAARTDETRRADAAGKTGAANDSEGETANVTPFAQRQEHATNAHTAAGSKPVNFLEAALRLLPRKLYTTASVAAAFVALIAVGLVFLGSPSASADEPIDLQSFYEQVTTHYSSLPPIGWQEADIEKAQKELAEQQAPVPQRIPQRLKHLRQIGFDVMRLKGHRVTFVRLRNEQRGHLHYLYVIDHKALAHHGAETSGSGEPTHQRLNGFDLTTWCGQNNHYVLVSPATEAP